MGYNASAAIANMRAGKGRTIYSMNYRQNENPRMRDCSSAITEALKAGGLNIYYGNGSAPNTVGMLNMRGNQFTQISEADAHAGDICVMGGVAGNGGAGHVFMLVSDSDEIECTPGGWNAAGVEGSAYAINEGNYGYLSALGWEMAWLRPNVSGNVPKPVKRAERKVDQIVNVGEFVNLPKPFKLDDVKFVNNIWQGRSNALCKSDFTWTDNGIPLYYVTLTDKNGKKKADQRNAKPGDYFVFDSKMEVLNLFDYKGRDMAEVNATKNRNNTYSFNIDLNPVVEVR